MTTSNKKILILAGPNGAGKTTFARAFLPVEAGVLHFINADLIAAGLSPFAPETVAIKAGRLMLDEVAQAVEKNQSFAIETTLSGQGYIRHIPQWRAQGYRVSLYFLGLPQADMAVERVAQRVRQGGHHIPEAVIRRRFEAGIKNLTQQYRHHVDDWVLYDNSVHPPRLLEWGEAGRSSTLNLDQASNPDLPASFIALQRAAESAKHIAIQTTTAIVVVENGQRVTVPATQLLQRKQG